MLHLTQHPLHLPDIHRGRHAAVAYVNGDFGPQGRIDHRALQLRWFDHYLKGIANDVDTEAPLNFFIMGDNAWRQEKEWPCLLYTSDAADEEDSVDLGG